MSKVCTFFGNSDISIPNEILAKAKSILIDLIENQNVTEFFCGGYGNFDNAMSNLIQDLKPTYPHIKSVYITAYLDSRFDFICKLTKYDETMFPPIENTPYKYRILKINEWMIKNVDFVIGYIPFTFGGAYKAWQYAEKQKHITKFWLTND